jgi:hypothetical protein
LKIPHKQSFNRQSLLSQSPGAIAGLKPRYIFCKRTGIITGIYAFIWLFRTFWQVTYLKQLMNDKPLLHVLLVVWFLMLFAAYSIPVAVKLF